MAKGEVTWQRRKQGPLSGYNSMEGCVELVSRTFFALSPIGLWKKKKKVFLLLTLCVPGIPKWDAEWTFSQIASNRFGICISVMRDGLREEGEEYVREKKN